MADKGAVKMTMDTNLFPVLGINATSFSRDVKGKGKKRYKWVPRQKGSLESMPSVFDRQEFL